jgi:hypothetical protein
MINSITFNSSGHTNHVWVEFTKEEILAALANVVGEKLDSSKLSDDKYQNSIVRKYKDHTSNRKLDTNHVGTLREAMDSGRWESDIDESPVLFRDGKLEGGQHRAFAFLKSGLKKIKFPCILNATDKDIAMQDSNKNRTMKNKVEMRMSRSLRDKIEKDISSVVSYRTVCASAKHLHANGDKKKLEQYAETDIVNTIAKYQQTYNDLANRFDEEKIDKVAGLLGYAPAVAAFIKIKESMDVQKWKSLVLFLDERNPDQYPVDARDYLENILDVHANRKQGAPGNTVEEYKSILQNLEEIVKVL